MNNNSKFIVFEGIDGAGKTTHIKLLQKALTERGISVKVSAEPTSSPIGLAIREILSGKGSATPIELAELFTQDRVFHNTDPDGGIESTLAQNVCMISDRYYYSSMAYQGVALGIDTVAKLNIDNPNIRKPDLCIFLDLTPEQSLQRINSERGSVEIFENIEMLTKTREVFYSVFDYIAGNGDRIVKINSYRDMEDVAADILAAVVEIL